MNLNKNWLVIIVESAKKNLKRLPKNDLRRLKEAIDQMELNPFGGDIVKLSGEGNVWRRRAGNYRILYEVLNKEKIIFVFDVKRRTSNTY